MQMMLALPLAAEPRPAPVEETPDVSSAAAGFAPLLLDVPQPPVRAPMATASAFLFETAPVKTHVGKATVSRPVFIAKAEDSSADGGRPAIRLLLPERPELAPVKTEITHAVPPPSITIPEAARPLSEQTILATRPERLSADVGVEIARAASTGKTNISIRLDPPELGRIDVRLELAPTGEVRGVIAADNAEAHEMLRRDEAALLRLLGDHGLKADMGALKYDLQGGADRPDPFDATAGNNGTEQDALASPSHPRSGLLNLLA